MSPEGQGKRQGASILIWLGAGLLLLALAAAAALVVLAWQESRQVQALQRQLQTIQMERAEADARLLELQGTAVALESRLATLEANDPRQRLAELQEAVEAAGDGNQIDALRASVADLQTQAEDFQRTLDSLAARVGTFEAKAPLPAEAKLTVARQKQGHNLSCESSAASMVAQFHDLDLSEAEVLAELPVNENPFLGFRGNVDGPPGGTNDYGVYAGPVLDVLNRRGLRAWSVEGGLDGIKAAIARGNPVIAWVTYDCQPGTPTTETIEGRAVTLVPYQHVVVVTGYDAGGVWANDPWDGLEDYYSTKDFARALGYFDNMAIEVAAP